MWGDDVELEASQVEPASWYDATFGAGVKTPSTQESSDKGNSSGDTICLTPDENIPRE